MCYSERKNELQEMYSYPVSLVTNDPFHTLGQPIIGKEVQQAILEQSKWADEFHHVCVELNLELCLSFTVEDGTEDAIFFSNCKFLLIHHFSGCVIFSHLTSLRGTEFISLRE